MTQEDGFEAQTIEQVYARYLETDGDIREHLPLLRKMASKCAHVTEFGVRGGVSTAALLAGQPQRLDCYDTDLHPNVGALTELRGRTGFAFHQEDVLACRIDPTDMLFIDTWHVYEQLRAELRRHAPQVRKWIVLHDTTTFGERGETPGHRGLWPAVEEFLKKGTFTLRERRHNCNGLAVLERVAPEPERAGEEPGAFVYLGVPYYQSVCGQVVDSWGNAVDPHGPDACATFYSGGSFHARNFNQLWAAALNSRRMGWTHFAMIHHDVRPHGYWLSTMLREMRQSGADLLHVVLPIKTEHGLTSTAVFDPASCTLRRLTMREVMALPADTFDAAGAGFPGQVLLASTGLWLCDFTRPWAEKVWFEVRDRIVQLDDGTFATETVSEDWAFSLTLHRVGLKVVGTKAVPAGHWGPHEYRNDEAWGTWETEREPSERFGGWEQWPCPG